MDAEIKERELKLWNDHLEHEAQRESATGFWYGHLVGHAMALGRLGVVDEEELREMLDLAEAANSHVIESLIHRNWPVDAEDI